MNADLYNSLAVLLSYPDEQTFHVFHSDPDPERGEGEGEESAFQSAIDNRQSAIVSQLSLFEVKVRPLAQHQLQELFIQTFDLSPVCSLEMGWHLFGENYDRGLLLVKIRQLLRACGVAEDTELPDHLTYALRLVPRLNGADAGYFVEAVVLPALRKMIAALAGKNNPYEHVLLAVKNLLLADFPEIRFAGAVSIAELRVLA